MASLAHSLHPFRKWHHRPAHMGRPVAADRDAPVIEVDWSDEDLRLVLSQIPTTLWSMATGEAAPEELVALPLACGIPLTLLSRRRALLVGLAATERPPAGVLADLAGRANEAMEGLRRLQRSLTHSVPVVLGPWTAATLDEGRAVASALTRRVGLLRPESPTHFARTQLLSWRIEERSRGRVFAIDDAPCERECITPPPGPMVEAMRAHLGGKHIAPEHLELLREGREVRRRYGEHLLLRFQIRNEQLVMRIALPPAMRDEWLIGRGDPELRALLLALRRTEVPGTARMVSLRHRMELCLWTLPGSNPATIVEALAPVLARIREVGNKLPRAS